MQNAKPDLPLKTFVRRSGGSKLGPDGHYEPKLVILAFRWGGRVIPTAEEGEILGITYHYLWKLTDLGLRPILGTDYEVWSIFVEDANDCMTLANSFHLIFGSDHPARRAKNVVSMFFLQPTGFDTRSQPALMTGDDDGAGSIEYSALYTLMNAVERTGIITRFPHNSGLYELLTNKSWVHMLAADVKLRIPASICVPKMWIENDVQEASERALKMLQMVKDRQAACGMCAQKTIDAGCAKLGYSWEALDVKMWQQKSNYKIGNALFELSKHLEITKNLVGQAHSINYVLVQEFIPHALEMRMYYIENQLRFTMFSRFDKVKDNHEFGGFWHMLPAEALKNYLNNDTAAMAAIIEEGKRISQLLLDFCKVQSCQEVIPAIRFDFFVQYEPHAGHPAVPLTAGSEKVRDTSGNESMQVDDDGCPIGFIRAHGAKGDVVLYTLEICELGFSILHNKKIPAEVMPAVVRSCLMNVNS